MVDGKKVVVVLPAYHASKTLARTVAEISPAVVDQILLVDDASSDETVEVARRLGLRTFVHEKNTGYGGNQKTCYREALALGADVVVMLHPDYQYSPRLVGAMVHMITSGHFDIVLGSRILGQSALVGGMPLYKYLANRALTLTQNVLLGQKLSEYHTGYRAYTAEVLRTLPVDSFSDDFVFDNQLLCSAVQEGFRVGEIACPTRYFPDASSINFKRSVVYGLGVLASSLKYARWTRRQAPRSIDPFLDEPSAEARPAARNDHAA